MILAPMEVTPRPRRVGLVVFDLLCCRFMIEKYTRETVPPQAVWPPIEVAREAVGLNLTQVFFFGRVRATFSYFQLVGRNFKIP